MLLPRKRGRQGGGAVVFSQWEGRAIKGYASGR